MSAGVLGADDPAPMFRMVDLIGDRKLDAVTFTSAPAVAFELWGVPRIRPERSRLAAMVKLMETELPARRAGTALDVAGHLLLLHGDQVLLDGVPVKLSAAPLAVLQALAVNPGHVVSRADLLAALPGGTASSEHAVEMAVARVRAAIGTRLVQTVVKRGYRLVSP